MSQRHRVSLRHHLVQLPSMNVFLRTQLVEKMTHSIEHRPQGIVVEFNVRFRLSTIGFRFLFVVSGMTNVEDATLVRHTKNMLALFQSESNRLDHVQLFASAMNVQIGQGCHVVLA